MSKQIVIRTLPCMQCGKPSHMLVDEAAFTRWLVEDELIQVAFPDMSTAEREQLKTGTHPACWDEMFPDEDEALS